MQGEDSITGEILPGFQSGMKAMSKTDAVRCKGLVEATRVLMVDVMSKEPEIEEVDESEAETDGEMERDWDVEDEGHEMDIARVYEQTIVQLGISLEDSTAFQAG